MNYVQFPEWDKDFARKQNKDWQRPSLLKYNPREVPLEKKTIRPLDWIPDPGRSKTEMAKALRKAWSLNVALHGRRKASYESECQDFFHDTPIALTSGGLFPDHFSYVLDSGASIHLICKKHIDTAKWSKIRKAHSPIDLRTANGVITVDQVISLYVTSLKKELLFYILRDSPPLLFLWGD